MATLTEKRYLDEEGLKQVLNLFNKIIPTNILKGKITVITIQNTINTYKVPESLENGEQRHVIFVNGGNQDYTITLPTEYKTPDGQELVLTVPVNGFAEANFVKLGGVIYARGI